MNTTTTPGSRPSRAQLFGTAGDAAKPPEQGVRAAAARAAFPAEESISDKPLSQVVGLLERVTRINIDWSIGNVFTDERKELKIVGGALRDLVEGNEYTFFGRHVNHPRYGNQFEVATAAPYLRPDRASIVKYIVKHFKGVGPTTAEKYISQRLEGVADSGAELEEVRQQLINAPWTIDFSAITKKAEYKNSDDITPIVNYVHRDLATRLGGLPGMKDSVLRALADYAYKLTVKDDDEAHKDPQVVQKCWATLVQDPYAPTTKVPGYAFSTADAIGASVNIPRDAPVRLKALVAYALELGCQRSGHVYLTHSQIGLALTAVDKRAPVEDAIRFGLEADMIVCDDEFGELRYYSPAAYEAEVELANNVAQLCRPGAPLSKQPVEELRAKIQEIAKQVAPHLKDGLDDSQVDALVGIMTSEVRLHTITAGPGCGKTQLMEILTAVLDHKNFMFCGPTGKSAKVLSARLKASGNVAVTSHSLLQGSGRGSFRYNATNKLDTEILVCDETSMNDLELSEALTAAVDQQRTHVILLGDDYQLPSIRVGRVLKDLLQIRQLDHHRLTKTHRNSGGILEVIDQVRKGKIDCQDREAVTFSHGLEPASESFIVIAAKYLKSVTSIGFENTALLMSLRAGETDTPGWNVTYANSKLRSMCNPQGERIMKSRMHVGDRILIRENMNVPLSGEVVAAKKKPAPRGENQEEPQVGETRIVNGDTGTIVSYKLDPDKQKSPVPEHVRIKLDDGRMIDLPGDAMDVLDHSYALTVHASQGSEYKNVIMVVTPGHPAFINRSTLFTGLSRARANLDINADDAVLRKVAATPLPDRNSALVQRVRDLFSRMPEVPKIDGDQGDGSYEDAADGQLLDQPEENRHVQASGNPPAQGQPAAAGRQQPQAAQPAQPAQPAHSPQAAAFMQAAQSRAQRFAAMRTASAPKREDAPVFPRQRGG